MPTYDYACAGCAHRFERFESINDDGPKECPQCGRKRARRMIGTGAGLIFKGSGFYTTDYKRPGAKPAEGGKKTEGEKKVEKVEKKEESKK
jgi:putative FmdB family regulatory protein